jgi:hypothetical protein
MANKVYVAQEAAITFQDSGGSAVITLNNLAAATGRVSARYDRGAGSIATRYLMKCVFDKGVAGVVGQIINVYVFTSDGTDADGTVGTSDAALTANQALNCFERPYPVVVNTTSTSVKITQSYIVEIPTRYFSIGVMNSTTGLLRASANVCTISLTPIPDEIQ